MVIVKNTSKDNLGFKDDVGKMHTLKAGEEVECPYKRSMDDRLEIEVKEKKKKGGKE